MLEVATEKVFFVELWFNSQWIKYLQLWKQSIEIMETET